MTHKDIPESPRSPRVGFIFSLPLPLIPPLALPFLLFTMPDRPMAVLVLGLRRARRCAYLATQDTTRTICGLWRLPAAARLPARRPRAHRSCSRTLDTSSVCTRDGEERMVSGLKGRVRFAPSVLEHPEC